MRAQSNTMRVLGAYVDMSTSSAAECERRIAQMWKALWARRGLLLDRRGHRRHRLRLVEKALTPVLMYSSGNWHVTLSIRKRLKSLQLHVYLDLHWHAHMHAHIYTHV